nr:Serine carboxypeptidase-like 17 [Ipomoea batatas]
MPPSASLLSAATKYQRLHDSILLLSSFLSARQQHSHTPAPPDSRTASPPHPRTSSTVTSAPRPIFEPAPLPRHDATVHQPPAFRCLKVILDQLEKLFKPDANALLREFGFQVLELLDIVQFKTSDTSSKSSQIVSKENDYKIQYAHGMALISDEQYEVHCNGKYQSVDPSNAKCLQDISFDGMDLMVPKS